MVVTRTPLSFKLRPLLRAPLSLKRPVSQGQGISLSFKRPNPSSKCIPFFQAINTQGNDLDPWLLLSVFQVSDSVGSRTARTRPFLSSDPSLTPQIRLVNEWFSQLEFLLLQMMCAFERRWTPKNTMNIWGFSSEIFWKLRLVGCKLVYVLYSLFFRSVRLALFIENSTRDPLEVDPFEISRPEIGTG